MLKCYKAWFNNFSKSIKAIHYIKSHKANFFARSEEVIISSENKQFEIISLSLKPRETKFDPFLIALFNMTLNPFWF